VSTTRREMLKAGWKIGGTMLALAAGWTTYEALKPLAGSGSGGKIALGAPSDVPAGTAEYVGEGRLWVANTGTEIFALSQKCPHLGCRVPFCESSGRFECACHGSIFDIGGEWVAGPSPRGMDQYPLELVDGVLIADTSELINGPDRGADQYYSDPKGPSCTEGA